MNAPLRRVGVVVFVLFAMLFVNLNYQQWWKADEYQSSDYNGRRQTDEYSKARGTITLANGEAIAQSVETHEANLNYLRVYPFKDEYAAVTGYKSVNLGATGVERLQNAFLAGNADSQLADRLAAMFTGDKPAGGNVLLTLSKAAQDSAYNELRGNKVGASKGAVVAIDPATGKLLAEVSMPSFDPNPLVSHDTDKATAAANALNGNSPDSPLRNRATSETLAPGSTMKVVVSAAALSNGLSPDTPVQAGASYNPPASGSFQMRNADPGICPQDQVTLKEALTVSCNTAFGRLGAEVLGADKVRSMAQAFGFESEPKFLGDDKNVMNVVPSRLGTMTDENGKIDPAAVAQSSIGQKDVKMTPLQGALIAAAVANGGRQMRPYVVDTLQSSSLAVVDKTQPSVQRRVVSEQVAGQLQDMMVSVVDRGTGRNAKISGFRVGGKTGTAENGENTNDHGWFIGFAMKDNKPIIAVAVMLQDAGRGGSGEATRIAGKVMKAYIDERGNK